jgi:hypothetical protein
LAPPVSRERKQSENEWYFSVSRASQTSFAATDDALSRAVSFRWSKEIEWRTGERANGRHAIYKVNSVCAPWAAFGMLSAILPTGTLHERFAGDGNAASRPRTLTRSLPLCLDLADHQEIRNRREARATITVVADP